jgi:hypothetical protein
MVTGEWRTPAPNEIFERTGRFGQLSLTGDWSATTTVCGNDRKCFPAGTGNSTTGARREFFRGTGSAANRRNCLARKWLEKIAGEWQVIGKPNPAHNGSQRYGTFKDVFNHRMQFVYGTHGNRAENDWALAKARFDAEILRINFQAD